MSEGGEERLLLPNTTSDEEEQGDETVQSNYEPESSTSNLAFGEDETKYEVEYKDSISAGLDEERLLVPNTTSDEEEQGDKTIQSNYGSLSSRSPIVVGVDKKKNEVEHKDSNSTGPVMEHLPHRNFISVDRFHILLRILVVITSLILGCLSLLLAYNSLALYLSGGKLSHLQMKLYNIYVRIMRKAFGFGSRDMKKMIGLLTSFVFLVVTLAVQSSMLIVAAGLHAARTVWIEECFSTFCHQLYAMPIFHSICFMIWYTIIAVSSGLGLLPYLEVSPIPIIVAIGAISMGVLIQRRIIPEMA